MRQPTWSSVLLVFAGLGPVWAQGEIDRQVDPVNDGERLREAEEPDPPPPPAEDPDNPLFIPEPGADPSNFPSWEPAEPDAPAQSSLWDQIRLDLEARGRVSGGHDTNVFRSESGRAADAYFRGGGEIDLAINFPLGAELLLELSGESLLYADHPKADEHFLSSFTEFFYPLTSWLDVGVQNAFEYSKQNLLDDNGDLFPRGNFGSVDIEPRIYSILRPLSDLSIETGASYRYKDYEENKRVQSLDYQELRFDAALSYKISRQPRSRAKLRYRFRRRDYRQLRARGRDGGLQADSPKLDLFRHQLTLSFYQELDVAEWLDARVIASASFVYNQDRFENDRTYRQLSGSLRVEWWILSELTKLEVGLVMLGRNFVVRQPVGQGGRLRHRLVDLTLEFWQRLGDLPVAAFASGAVSLWRSGDPREDYDRYLMEAGLEVFW